MPQLFFAPDIFIRPVSYSDKNIPKLTVVDGPVLRPDGNDACVLRHGDVPRKTISHVPRIARLNSFAFANIKKQSRIWLSLVARDNANEPRRSLKGPTPVDIRVIECLTVKRIESRKQILNPQIPKPVHRIHSNGFGVSDYPNTAPANRLKRVSH